MDEMKLRGFVTPEDFSGSDTEKLQSAIDTAKEKDICKVIIKSDLKTEKTIVLPPLMHIVLDGAAISAGGDFPVFANSNFYADKFHHSYSFIEDMFFIEGNGTINGNVDFYNAYRVVIQNIEINGSLGFEFTTEVRLDNLKINGDTAINIKRGSNNFIIEHLSVTAKDIGILLDTKETETDYVIGKEAGIDEIIIKDCEIKAPTAIAMEASHDGAIFNTVIDNIKTDGTGLTVSKRQGELSPELYRDITATNFISKKAEPIKLYSKTKHCYFS